jgi:hypothetical protein
MHERVDGRPPCSLRFWVIGKPLTLTFGLTQATRRSAGRAVSSRESWPGPGWALGTDDGGGANVSA